MARRQNPAAKLDEETPARYCVEHWKGALALAVEFNAKENASSAAPLHQVSVFGFRHGSR